MKFFFLIFFFVFLFQVPLEAKVKKEKPEPSAQAESLPTIEVNLPNILRDALYIGKVKMVAYRHGEVMEVLVSKTYKGTWKDQVGYTVDLSAYQWKKRWIEANPPVDILGKEVIIVMSQSAKLEAVGRIEKDKVKFECFRPNQACVISPNSEMSLGELKVYQERK